MKKIFSQRWNVLIGKLVACSACAVVLSVNGQTTLTAEDKLSAVRNSLIQAALDGPIQVKVTSWIDAQGVLRDSSSFKTGMQVRGVKILAYDHDTQGQPTADLSWQPSPVKKITEPANACSKSDSSGRLQHVIGLTVGTGTSWDADELTAMLALRNQLIQQLQQASNDSSVWRTSPGKAIRQTAYEQALLGSSTDDAPWQAILTLQPMPRSSESQVQPTKNPQIPPWFLFISTSNYQNVLLKFSLTARHEKKPLLESGIQLRLELEHQKWASPQLTAHSLQLVTQQVETWSHELQERLRCEPVLPDVTHTSAQDIQINAGTLAGVRVGDEWLLADRQAFPSQLLDAGAIEKTILAKVNAVGEHHSQLELLTVQKQSIPSNWRAWPTNTHP